MLRYLRENTGNWIIKIFLGIIVIVFVFLGVGSFGTKTQNSVAMIEDEPITLKEYQQAYKTMVEQLRARFGNSLNEDLLKLFNVKQQALNSLIEQKLLQLEADKLNIQVSEKELQAALLSVKEFQKDGKFDLDLYKRVLGLNQLNPEIFEQMQINSIRKQKIVDMITNTVTVSDQEAETWYKFQNTKISLNYLLFDPSAYQEFKPNEDHVQSYYNENKEQYKSEPKIKAVYLKFSPQDYADKVSVDDTLVKDYFDQHPEEFKVPEKAEARHILIKVDETADDDAVKKAEERALAVYEKAVNGEDFEALAKEYSEGPSKDSGGYLGIFERQSMIKPFGDKVFSMKKDEISKPLRTSFGWHVIKVMNRFAASSKSFDEVSASIRTRLEDQERLNQAYYKAEEAFDAVIDGDPIEQVASIVGKKIQQTQAFSATGKGLPMEDSAEFASTAFELPLDSISDVKQIRDSYYLIKVTEKIDPVVQDYDTVKDKVFNDLALKLRKDRARKEAETIVEKAVLAKNIKKTAQENSLTIKTTNAFSRNESIDGVSSPAKLIEAGFTLTPQNPVYSEVIETEAGYFIIGLEETKVPGSEELAENLNDIKNQILMTKQAQSYQAWLTELKKNYDISYNPELIN